MANGIKIFKGNSYSLNYRVPLTDGSLFRKISPLKDAAKLRYQAEWLEKFHPLGHTPEVLGRLEDDSTFGYELKYYENYKNFFEYIHENNLSLSRKKLESVLQFLREKIHTDIQSKITKDLILKYIDQKIVEKLKRCVFCIDGFENLLNYKNFYINGEFFDNPLELLEKNRDKIVDFIQENTILSENLHGDTTMENILVNEDDFLLVDPNSDNFISDPLVDYAKFLQSLHSGYEFQFLCDNVFQSHNKINYSVNISDQYRILEKYLMGLISLGLDKNRLVCLKFHQAVHFSRLLTYRANAQDKNFYVFFGTFVKLFNEFFQELQDCDL